MMCEYILMHSQKVWSSSFPSSLTQRHSFLHTGKIPLISSAYEFCRLTKQPFTIRCLWWGLSCPHLLLSNRPIVRRHLCTTLLLSERGRQPTRRLPLRGAGPFRLARLQHLCDSEQPGAAEANQRSEPWAPSSHPRPESFPWPSQLLQTPTQQKRVAVSARRERAGKGREKDRLSQMRFVCEVPSWQSGWLLHLDIMGPLIHSAAVPLCDCGHSIARSINRVIHHHLPHHHHHHPRQHHMMAWWCFPPLHSENPKQPMLMSMCYHSSFSLTQPLCAANLKVEVHELSNQRCLIDSKPDVHQCI